MNQELDFQALAGAEACFAVASRLLYCEPEASDVAEQVLTRPYADAPFATDNPWAVRGLALMDTWCTQTLAEAAASLGAAPQTVEELVSSSVFDERVVDLRREWLRLFAGVGAPEASCLESFYVEPNSHMFAKNTLAVREVYRKHGLQIEKLHSEPDDHLGLMLAFVGHLINEELSALDAGDVDRAAHLAADQEAFLVEHMLPWLAAWRYAVAQHGSSDYFRGAGDFVFGLCASYAERFGVVFSEEDQAFKRRR